MADKLRSQPVHRDEVRIYLSRDPQLECWTTMPLGTYRTEKRGYSESFIADPTLWQPLMDELEATRKARHAHLVQHFATIEANGTDEEKWAARWAAGFMLTDPLPQLEISGYLYQCDECGIKFADRPWPRRQLHLCSNKCERTRSAAYQRQWRKENPPDYQTLNAKRDQQRAEARAGRTCEHCGVAIKASRSTRRFCSDLCRVRAHHQRAEPCI